MEHAQTPNPFLPDHACSLLLCAVLHTSFNIHSKITLKKYTTAIISSRPKHRLQSWGLLSMWIILSGLCTDSQARNGLSSYQPSYLDNERRKIQNRFQGQKMTHRSSVVLSHPELRDKQIWPHRMFQVPEDTGQWQTNQTPSVLFDFSPLQSNYLVELAGLLEFHRVLCFLLDTTLRKNYLNTRAGEGGPLFREEIQQSRMQNRATLHRHWEATRSLHTQTFDSIVNVCGMRVDKRKNVAVFPVTLWTDRWDSSSQFDTLLFLTGMLGG